MRSYFKKSSLIRSELNASFTTSNFSEIKTVAKDEFLLTTVIPFYKYILTD